MNLLLLKNVTFSLTNGFVPRYKRAMADVAQLVRAPGCGPGGRRFKTGHSPHFFLFVLLSMGTLLAEQTKVGAEPSPLSVVSNVIKDQTPLQASYEKPHITIIVDQFCMREDLSRELINKLSANVILCVPAHCMLQKNIIEDAQKFNFNLSISIDYLTEEQWSKLQKVIEERSWIKGLVIWSVSTDSNLVEFLGRIKEWLNTRGIWIVYANSNNVMANSELPMGIFVPDGFVVTFDKSIRVTEQANFVLAQAKFKDRGLLLVQPGVHHLSPLVDWLQENVDRIQLDNWSK